ncbi:hypothetical protein [Mycobacterium sp. Marseille-P9652]|uniref:hypothetical protein n=1 Tax=Mycobacterium sp. Marseille-P9652 TaxID=2654950 RepID=UPI0018D0CE8E|nr:hypothetical protein [Mycobacterium sp. Marseille-P9652]
MSTLQALIGQGPTNLDVVTPIKERACHALYAVLRSRPKGLLGQGGPDVRLMPRGAERC